MSEHPGPTLLQVRHVTKRFAGVKALDEVNLTLQRGQVHAVIGENGAGKSTLMKVLAGVLQPDAGQILLDGKSVVIDSVQSALDRGIALIHQELNLADNLDVGANIFLGREPRKCGLIRFGEIRRNAKHYLDLVGLDISPTTIVDKLTIGRQQLVEIAKALSVDARILIMDEPTSSLTHHEAEQLFRVIRQLRAGGVAMIYVSHRLAEVSKLADSVTVLRDGENAGNLERQEIDHGRMVRLMVGRDISQFYARRPHPIGTPLLQVRNLVTSTWPRHSLDFTVHAGEMVGVAGLVGAGRTEVLRTLFGVDSARAGEIRVAGKHVKLGSSLEAIRAGIVLVPEDRKQHGLVLQETVRNNIGLPSLQRHQYGAGLLNRRRERDDAARMIESLKIKTPSDRQQTQYLSGGNQQKVVLAKWLAMEPRVLLLDEPTRGVDVGAKQEIYGLMEELAERGVAILFVSSEMDEVLSMSDRTLVMHEGRLSGELNRDQLSEEAIMQLATGGGRTPDGGTQGSNI